MKKICMLICAVTCVLALGLVCLSGCGTKQLSESQNSSQSSQTSAQQSTSSDENSDTADEKASSKSKTDSGKKTDAADSSSDKTGTSSTDASSSSKESASSSSKSTSKSTKSSSSSSKKSGSSSSSSSKGSSAKKDTNTITVSVTIDGKGFIANKTADVTLEKGASAFDALVKIADSIGGNNKYVSAINGLAEKQHGKLSGWMYSVNGEEPNVACGKYVLEDGDVVNWHYVNVED